MRNDTMEGDHSTTFRIDTRLSSGCDIDPTIEWHKDQSHEWLPIHFDSNLDRKTGNVSMRGLDDVKKFMADCVPAAGPDSIDAVCLVVTDDAQHSGEKDTLELAELLHVRMQLLLLGRFDEEYPALFAKHEVRMKNAIPHPLYRCDDLFALELLAVRIDRLMPSGLAR